MLENQERNYLLCIDNRDCEDLIKGKVYHAIPDEDALVESYVRVIDESGEDYLYPQSYFTPVELSATAKTALSSVLEGAES